MALNFHHVCDLFDELESLRLKMSITSLKPTNAERDAVTRWVDKHRGRIHGASSNKLAILSTVFPERVPDRVCGLGPIKMAREVGHALGLGRERLQLLHRYERPGHGDFAVCLERVMRQTEIEISPANAVTVEDVDQCITRIAALCPFSHVRIQQMRVESRPREVLCHILRRMTSREGKWLARLIQKDLTPVVMPEQAFFAAFHFQLPGLLRVQESFEAALYHLAQPPFKDHPTVCPRERAYAQHLRKQALAALIPKIGFKIGRKKHHKSRSLKHCENMIGGRTVSVDRKYDGEYCQIHVNLESQYPFQIFSKSGKESTLDRRSLFEALRVALAIGTPECRIKQKCILEGELLVWNEKHREIAEFHKIRKYVTRSGRYMGTDVDSQ